MFDNNFGKWTWQIDQIGLPNVDQFSNFFHQVIRKKILYIHIINIFT